MMNALNDILTRLAAGNLSPAAAEAMIRAGAAQPLGFATVDHHRAERCGAAEVIYAAGKTPEQVVAIAKTVLKHHGVVLVTRTTAEQVDAMRRHFPDVAIKVAQRAGTVIIGNPPAPQPELRSIPIVTAGTSDEAVAEEAELTCAALGHATLRVNDVGVAGLHRLGTRLAELREAAVIVCIAGMEGALPSVLGGLVEAPVIAVPTSVGYGAAFGGVAALLGMLTSCASGVSVVNIDNGYGAAYTACMINRQVRRAAPPLSGAPGESGRRSSHDRDDTTAGRAAAPRG